VASTGLPAHPLYSACVHTGMEFRDLSRPIRNIGVHCSSRDSPNSQRLEDTRFHRETGLLVLPYHFSCAPEPRFVPVGDDRRRGFSARDTPDSFGSLLLPPFHLRFLFRRLCRSAAAGAISSSLLWKDQHAMDLPSGRSWNLTFGRLGSDQQALC